MSLIFDIECIPEEEGLIVDTRESGSSFNIDSEDAVLEQSALIQGELTRIGMEILWKGTLETEATLKCSRCLESFHSDLKSNLSTSFVPTPVDSEPEGERELNPGDIDVEYYSGNEINLAQGVYDQILLSLPMARLCKEDCKGICPQCGINLNNESCSCELDGDVDPRLTVLKSLKNKLK